MISTFDVVVTILDAEEQGYRRDPETSARPGGALAAYCYRDLECWNTHHAGVEAHKYPPGDNGRVQQVAEGRYATVSDSARTVSFTAEHRVLYAALHEIALPKHSLSLHGHIECADRETNTFDIPT